MKKMADQAMRGNVLAEKCPSRTIMQHLTNRWGTLVMIVLRGGGGKRFGVLRKEIEGISERMLAQTLQQLERDGMVRRRDFQTVPPHVEYSLTSHGEQAAAKLADLVDWLEGNLDAILAAAPADTVV